MKYLCLIYDEEKKLQGCLRTRWTRCSGNIFSFTTDVRTSGHFLGGNDLQPVASATTVRVRNGKVSTASAQGRRL